MAGAQVGWNGFHYDGVTAHREPVTIAVTAEGLQVTRSDGQEVLWPFDAIRRAPARGAEVRLETIGEPVQSLLVTDPGLPEAIRDVGARLRTARDGTDPFRVLQWTAGGVAVAAVCYFWAFPAFADFVAPRIPLAWEQRMGEQVVARMAPTTRHCTGPGKEHLDAIMERLVSAAPETGYTFTLIVLDQPVVNAFAAPGGYVVVARGLLDEVESPEQLAGVLAHELQHVIQRHPTRGMVREVPLRLALAVLAGGNDGADIAARAAGTLGVMRYRRTDELEADREGMRLIQHARVDPAGMVEFMKALDASRTATPRLASYLSTHPHAADRVAVLEALAQGADYQPEPLLSAEAWAEARAICGPPADG